MSRAEGTLGEGPGERPHAGDPSTWDARWGLAIFALALGIRLGFLWSFSDSPTFFRPIVDALTHHQLAIELLETGEVPKSLFWRSPFYPVALSAIYFAFGPSILAAKVAQALLGAVTCWATYALARRIFDRAAGVVAGTIVAVYGPLLFWEADLAATAWASFASVALLGLALRCRARSSLALHVAFGVLGGVAILTRPGFLPFVLLTIVWLAVAPVARSTTGGRTPRRSAVSALHAVAAVGGCAAVLVPAAFASQRLADHASFLPRSAALNLHIGNNADRCRTLAVRPGREWRQLRGRAYADGEGSESEVFRDLVIDYAQADPIGFVRGILEKLAEVGSGEEIPRNVDIYSFRGDSAILSALVWRSGRFGFPFGVLLPLAVVGLALRWRDVPAPLWIFVTTYPLVIALTFVAGRYRLPWVPALAVLAGGGVATLAARLRHPRRWRRARWQEEVGLLAAGSALVLLAHAVPPTCRPDFDFRSELFVFLATGEVERGDTSQAIAFYEQALRWDSDSARAHLGLAGVLYAGGDFESAISHCDAALRAGPDPWALQQRGSAHGANGDVELAGADFRAALSLEPGFAPAHEGLGSLSFRAGDYARARREFEEAVRLARTAQEASRARGRLRYMDRHGF